MTPPALTPAARATRKATSARTAPATDPSPAAPRARATRSAATPTREKPVAGAPAGNPRSAGHRTGVRRSATPRAPRRVSGPLSGLTRRSGAARPQPEPRPARRRSAPPIRRGSLLTDSLAYVRALPDHPLLDRVVRGRAWIPLLGVLLVGIVAMQVEVLKLNAGIGRGLELSTALQSRNEALRVSVAGLADDQRIESMAAKMGMVMEAPGAVRFLSTGAATDQRAVTSIQQPDSTSFTALLAADDPGATPATSPVAGTVATGAGTAVTTTSAGGVAVVPSTTSAAGTATATAAGTAGASTAGVVPTTPVSPPATVTPAAGTTAPGTTALPSSTQTTAPSGTASGTGTAPATGTAAAPASTATGTGAAAGAVAVGATSTGG
ncbi:MAG: hypothetical protein ABSH51_09560 [Solirubrobacteraceae bacterium]